MFLKKKFVKFSGWNLIYLKKFTSFESFIYKSVIVVIFYFNTSFFYFLPYIFRFVSFKTPNLQPTCKI